MSAEELLWWVLACVAFVSGSVVASVGGLYGYRFACREAGPERCPAQVRARGWWKVPSFCEGCGQALGVLGRQPLVGALWGCRECGRRGPVLYPALEWTGGALGVTAFVVLAERGWVGGWWVILVWVGFAAASAAADRARLIVPLVVSVWLFWGGLLLSPVGTTEDRVWGAFGVWGVALAGYLWVRRREGRVGFGLGDVALAACCGAWMGFMGGVAAYGLGLVGCGLGGRERNVVPVGPWLGVSGSIVLGTVLVLQSIGY